MLLRKKPIQKDPQPGDYRIDIKYAWWPVWTYDGIVWMERYKKIYEYVVRERLHFIGRFHFYHTGGGWDLRQIKRCKPL
jgi:hypothetical protein